MQEQDMIPSRTEICSEEKLMTVVQRHQSKLLPTEGYRNRGNTCYVNSVLQCLLKGTPLGVGVFSADVGGHDCTKDRCLLCLLGKVYETGDRSMQQMIYSILQSIKGLAQYRQEDAHEFYRSLVDNIHESYVRNHVRTHSVKKVPGLEQTSFPYRLFSGWMQQKTICSTCNKTSTVYQPFIDLSISLSDVSTLEQGLHALTKPEELSGYECDACGTAVKAEKQSLIHRPPPVLVVQLQRFQFRSLNSSKITKQISYPMTLDITHYTDAPSCDANKYTLTALINHVGETVNFGHYVCAVAHNGNWFFYNDSQVRSIRVDTVLRMVPYLLFYTRSDFLQETRSSDDVNRNTEHHQSQVRAVVEREREKERQIEQERFKLQKFQLEQKRGEGERQLHKPKKKQTSTNDVKKFWKTAPPPLISQIDSAKTLSPLKMERRHKEISSVEKSKRRTSMRELKKRKPEEHEEDPDTINNHSFLFDFGNHTKPAEVVLSLTSCLLQNDFEATIIPADSPKLPMYLGIFTSYPPDCRNRIATLERVLERWSVKITLAQKAMMTLFVKNKLNEKSNCDVQKRIGNSNGDVSDAVLISNSLPSPSPSSLGVHSGHSHSKLQMPDLGPRERDVDNGNGVFCNPESPTSPSRQSDVKTPKQSENGHFVPMGAQDLSRLDHDLDLLGIIINKDTTDTPPPTEEGSPDSLLNLQSTLDDSMRSSQVDKLTQSEDLISRLNTSTEPTEKFDILQNDSSEN